MVGGDLIGAQGIRHRDVQIGANEWKIIVAAIPDDDVGFPLGLSQDRGVVDSGLIRGSSVGIGFTFICMVASSVQALVNREPDFHF